MGFSPISAINSPLTALLWPPVTLMSNGYLPYHCKSQDFSGLQVSWVKWISLCVIG